MTRNCIRHLVGGHGNSTGQVSDSREYGMRRKPERHAEAVQSVSGPQQGRHDVHDGANI